MRYSQDQFTQSYEFSYYVGVGKKVRGHKVREQKCLTKSLRTVDQKKIFKD